MEKKKYLASFLLIVLALSLGTVMKKGPGKERIFHLTKEPEVVIQASEGPKTMYLEEYIAGVVAGEMRPGWSLNAYGAQAIIARTFALSYMEEKKTNVLSADFREAQVYKPEDITPVITEAVENTRGQVALYKGRYIRGFFHSNAGGRTTIASVGMDYFEKDPPYIHSVKSPDNLADEDILAWEVEFPEDLVRGAVSALVGQEIGKIRVMTPINIALCGRARDIEIMADDGKHIISAPAFRTEIGSEDIRSTRFIDIDKKGDNFLFSGTGFGHGVGMSQYGAEAMARRGNSPKDIIRYYFKGINIKKIYS